ncbi:hypothetical protein GF312_18760, partial [Candidatus Poribacteria bacterium]|nr:hypothetical protein [Candidatus Poribacteria bacterium]
MTLYTCSWEEKLLEKAYKAFEEHVEFNFIDVDRLALEEAYEHCRKLTKHHSRTFYVASSLLPGEKCRAARALYSFCRISDDLVDIPEGDLQSGLNEWKKRSLSETPSIDDPVVMAWTHTRMKYKIPIGYAQQLID